VEKRGLLNWFARLVLHKNELNKEKKNYQNILDGGTMADPLPLLDKATTGDEEVTSTSGARVLYTRRWYILFVLSMISLVQVRTTVIVATNTQD